MAAAKHNRKLVASIMIVAIMSPAHAAMRDLTGQWGGDHINLVFDSRGGHVRYDCGAGEIMPKVRLDRHGRFRALGTHMPSIGPMLANDGRTGVKTLYSGNVSGTTLNLKVEVEGVNEAQHYILTRNRRTMLFACL
jgi:hypothetical protein